MTDSKPIREEIDIILASYALSFAPTEKQYGIFMEEANKRILSLFSQAMEEVIDDWEVAIRFSENEVGDELSREVMENHLKMAKAKLKELLK